MRSFLLIVGLLAAIPSVADSPRIRLMCTIFDTSDGTAVSSPPAKDLVAVHISSGGETTITSKHFRKELVGTLTDHEIVGYWRGAAVSEELYINRYTSEYRYSVIYDDSARKSIAVFGSCQLPAKPAS